MAKCFAKVVLLEDDCSVGGDFVVLEFGDDNVFGRCDVFTVDVFVALAPDSTAELPALQDKIGFEMVTRLSIVEMAEGMVVIMGFQPRRWHREGS